GALGGRLGRPGGEGGLGRLDRVIDVAWGRFGEAGDDFTGAGIEDLERIGRGAGHRFAVYHVRHRHQCHGSTFRGCLLAVGDWVHSSVLVNTNLGSPKSSSSTHPPRPGAAASTTFPAVRAGPVAPGSF